MQMYLVITYYPNGSRRKRAFLHQRAALAFAAAHGDEVETEIQEVPLHGELEFPDVGYTLYWNDAELNMEHVDAVCGSHHDAQQIIGGHGRVQQLSIDNSDDGMNAVQSIPFGIRRNNNEIPHPLSWIRQNRERGLLETCRPVALRDTGRGR